MSTILIVDDSSNKIEFIEECIEGGPLELREIPRITAGTIAEAKRIIEETMDLRGGLIDCHLDDFWPTLDGPEIMKFWREIETEQARERAFLVLQTGSSVTSDDYKRCAQAAMDAGADAAVSLVYNRNQSNELISPVDALREVLVKMVPYFVRSK